MSIPKIADFHKFCNALSKTSRAACCHSHLYRLCPALLIALKRNLPTQQAQIAPHPKLPPPPLLSATKKPFRFAKRLFVYYQIFKQHIYATHCIFILSYMCVVLSSPMPSMPSTTYFLPLVSVT